ncbi:MAG: class I SAM-dependent methyltransferase [Bacteroidota bacterium]|nr:class I SAM-dependent methyltransferase [Bacteroidota bacterium]
MSNQWFVERKKCPACASTEFKTIYQNACDKGPVNQYLHDFYSTQGNVEEEYLIGAEYALYKCINCNLIFQRDIPNDFLMERLYEHWLDPKKVFELNKKVEDLSYYAKYAQEVMRIIAFLDKEPSSLKILDFGMGWAKWALMVKAFGVDSYGMELSQERIQHAKENGIKVISWDEVSQHQFDMINTEQVFEHIPHPLETLRHLSGGLKKGGIIKISVPTANDIERRLKVMDWKAPKGSANSLNAVAPLEHINYFCHQTFNVMANKVGLEIVQIPLRIQYQFITDVRGLKKKLKNFVFPIFINILKKRNYVFLRKK